MDHSSTIFGSSGVSTKPGEAQRSQIVVTPDGIRRLRRCIADLCKGEESARRLAADSGLDVARIDFHGGSIDFCGKMLDEARDASRLPEIAAAALRHYPTDTKLWDLIEEILPESIGMVGAPLAFRVLVVYAPSDRELASKLIDHLDGLPSAHCVEASAVELQTSGALKLVPSIPGGRTDDLASGASVSVLFMSPIALKSLRQNEAVRRLINDIVLKDKGQSADPAFVFLVKADDCLWEEHAQLLHLHSRIRAAKSGKSLKSQGVSLKERKDVLFQLAREIMDLSKGRSRPRAAMTSAPFLPLKQVKSVVWRRLFVRGHSKAAWALAPATATLVYVLLAGVPLGDPHDPPVMVDAGPPQDRPVPVPEPPLTPDDFARLGDIRFDFDAANLAAESVSILEAATLARRRQVLALRIEGHADDRGLPGHNQRLSEQRAAAVRDALSEMLPGVQIDAVGYGTSYPTCTDRDAGEPCFERNRRVRIVPCDLPSDASVEARTHILSITSAPRASSTLR